jgi:Tfp pilus assembly protein PilN
MVRINLLPKEVLERRRYERWFAYVFIAFAALLALIAIFWGYFWFSGAQKNADLQLLQEQSQKLQSQADAFGIFEQKEQELVKRQAIAVTSLAGRINMGRVAEEVSLVLPDEVWLQSMGISQTDGLTVVGYTPRTSSHSMEVSYKSVAKTLVRLNELESISDVWLTSAVNAEYTGFAPVTGKTFTPAPVVNLSIKGKVSPIATDASGEK